MKKIAIIAGAIAAIAAASALIYKVASDRAADLSALAEDEE